MHGTNFTITTNELAKLLKNRNIRLTNQVGEFDQFMGTASGGGVIFGNTGGVMRAALRTAHFNITGSNPPPSLLNLEEVQGLSGFRQAKVTIGSISLNVAVCYEMRNARMLLEQVMNGSCNFDFIEVMACKGGCVGGAGQPADCSELRNRINALNIADTQASTRFCHENQEIQTIYQNFLGNTGSQTAKKYLHTSFNNKSDLLVTGE
ncbi:MAG: iron hydrogenase small subunit [Bacteroidales bacterium]|nr:iron hydrogenase small subunit [Bacteroidales bacterium]